MILALLLSLATSPAARLERTVPLMGTVLRIEVEAPSRAAALAASERAIVALEATEARLSTWRDDSELARLNAAAVGEAMPLSRELADELDRAAWCSRVTEGAFDPAIGALLAAWDLRGAGRIPAPAEIAAALGSGGRGALELEAGRAVKRVPGLRLEEGGFGKGAGLDRALAALAEGEPGLRALLDLGGQLAVFGQGEHRISIADPRDRGRPVLELTLAAGSASTSGNSEQGRTLNGRPIGHLFDPRTGQPAPDFGSVTVLAPSALTADCLSTGLFVLGPERALAFAAAHPEVEVVVLETVPAGLRARASAGLAGRLRRLVFDLL